MLFQAGFTARTTTVSEPRGADGLDNRLSGLDQGVFIPFQHVCGLETDIPIVEVPINLSLAPRKNGSWSGFG